MANSKKPTEAPAESSAKPASTSSAKSESKPVKTSVEDAVVKKQPDEKSAKAPKAAKTAASKSVKSKAPSAKASKAAPVEGRDEKKADPTPEVKTEKPVDVKSSVPKTDTKKTTQDAPATKADDATSKSSTKPSTPASAPAAKSSNFLPLLLGGAIAATIGFGAARYPDQWPFGSGEDPIAVELAAQAERLSAIEATGQDHATALAALENDDSLNVARGEISGEFSQLRTQLEAMSATLSDLENRLHTVEKLPQGSGMEAAAAAASAYERELQQMRQMLDAELAKITSAKEDAATLEESAAEAAKAAGARAALARVLAALDTGRPYGDALFDLTQQAEVEAPAALSTYAENGVPTLANLQAGFPDAARAALDASIRSAVEAGEIDRVSAFLRLQLGTRSLSPKEGDDPDAILSRAEAALKSGQIGAALDELATMPEAGLPALAAWVADATARKDALAAGETLAQLVNSK